MLWIFIKISQFMYLWFMKNCDHSRYNYFKEWNSTQNNTVNGTCPINFAHNNCEKRKKQLLYVENTLIT